MAKTPVLTAFAFLIACLACSGQKYILLDSKLQKPIQTSATFSEVDIFGQRFPIYQEDLPKVVSQAVAVAKSIGRKKFSDEYIDTLVAGHSIFVAKAERVNDEMFISVYLKTMLSDMNVLLQLIERRQGKREVQLQLLAFTDYLNAQSPAPPALCR